MLTVAVPPSPSPPSPGAIGLAGSASSPVAPKPPMPVADAVTATPSSVPPFRLIVATPPIPVAAAPSPSPPRSEEHTSELQSLMSISYAVFCLKKKPDQHTTTPTKQVEHTTDQ